MTEENRSSEMFHLGDLLSITDGHLVSLDHIGGVYKIIDFVTGQPHFTHQLPRACDAVKPWLLQQHPWLAEITVPDGLSSEAEVVTWLAVATAQWGEWHEVSPMSLGMYVGREPIAELVEMVGKDRVITVEIPGDERDA